MLLPCHLLHTHTHTYIQDTHQYSHTYLQIYTNVTFGCFTRVGTATVTRVVSFSTFVGLLSFLRAARASLGYRRYDCTVMNSFLLQTSSKGTFGGHWRVRWRNIGVGSFEEFIYTHTNNIIAFKKPQLLHFYNLPKDKGEVELDVWKSFDTTGHLCPYMAREDPESCRKPRETLLTKGHLETVVDTFIPDDGAVATYILVLGLRVALFNTTKFVTSLRCSA